jgi:prepilin-type N-terminal cleavage/methylation domain-containing protein
MRIYKGFTLIELVITASIFAMVGTGLGVLAYTGFRSWDQNRAQVDAQENAREALTRVTKTVREAQPSNNGSYPIFDAEAQTLTIYADVDGDGNREQVRYFLSGTQLKQGTIKPVGTTPATYPAGNESVTVISNFIRNNADPIFTYFDKNFTGTQAALTQPVNLLNVRLVHINLMVDVDPSKPPTVITLETSVSFRNLKDNL